MIIKCLFRKNEYIYQKCQRIIDILYYIKYRVAKKRGNLVKLISNEYKKNTGYTLSNPPISYTEKMQYAKIFDALFTRCGLNYIQLQNE